MLPVASLTPSGLNPRLEVGDLTELADSIRELGVLVPLLVAPFHTGYIIIAGHRRHAAAKKLKLTEVPAIVRKASELERLELMIVENQQRVPLTPVEEGIAFARILKNHPVTQLELSKRLGVSDWYVSTRLAILNLPKHVVQEIHRGELSVSVALGYRDDGTGRQARKPQARKAAARSTCVIDVHRKHDPVVCEISSAARQGVRAS
jgi:ParB family chromosome partitioning protein